MLRAKSALDECQEKEHQPQLKITDSYQKKRV